MFLLNLTETQWYLYLLNQDLWLERCEEAPLVQHSGLGTYQVNILALSFHFNTMGKLNKFSSSTSITLLHPGIAPQPSLWMWPQSTIPRTLTSFQRFVFYTSQILGLQFHLTFQSHLTFPILDHTCSISIESVWSFQVELDFCKAAPNKGGLKEEKGYQVGWIVDVIFRFWKPFITFKMFEEQGYPVCGIALCFFNTTFENLARHSDTFWKYLTTSVSGLDVYELHIQKVSKYFNFCRQRYHLVFKTYDAPNVCFIWNSIVNDWVSLNHLCRELRQH